MTNYRATILVFTFLATFFFCHRAEASKPSRDILIVHSYHQGFHWTDNVMAGMLDVLQKEVPDAELHVEYLDAKRIPPETFSPLFDETLRRKFSGIKPTVILVSDDAAFDLMLDLREKHFPGVPLVFCGVNKFNDERIAGHAAVTGVAEDFNIKETVEIALKLHPTAKHMAVINDSTLTGEFNRQRFLQVAPEFSDRVDVIELFDLSTEELSSKLKSLPKDSFILKLSLARDRSGRSYSTNESNHMIASLSGLPVYSCWDFILVGDVVGGLVVSGHQQGEASASMAAKILKGLRAEDIPILRKSPNAYMFDYKVMQRFGIVESSLPKGSIVLNRQESLWAQYGDWLLGIVVIGGLQTVLILVLLHLWKRLRMDREALQKSESKFRALFDYAGEGIFLADNKSNITDANHSAANMLGYASPRDLVGMNAKELIHPDDLRKMSTQSNFEKAKKDEVLRFERRYRRNDGSYIPVQITIKFLGDSGLHHVLFSDISERIKAEEALKESEEKFRSAFDSSPDAVNINRLSDGLYIEVNQGFTLLTGYTPEDVCGRTSKDINIWCDDRDRDRLVKELKEQGVCVNLQAQFRKKDESITTALMSARAITLSGELHIVSITRDISERIRTERLLDEIRREFESIFDNSHVGIMLLKAGRFLSRCNQRLAEILGYESTTVMKGMSMREIHLDEAHYTNFGDRYYKRLSQGEQTQIDYQLKKKNGDPVWCTLSGKAIDPADLDKGVVWVVDDLSNRKIMEKELVRSKELAESANKVKTEFLANMSHEIRTPLNGIIGMLQLLQMSLQDEEQKEITELALLSGRRLTTLLSDILDISAIEAGKLSLASAPASAYELLNSVHNLFDITARQKGLKLKIKIDPKMPETIISDETRLKQILFNLVGNGLKFTPIGQVSLDICPLPVADNPCKNILFIVSDTGLGIPEDRYDTVFEPFGQISEGYTRSHQGAGLGLPIVKRVVDLMRGTICIESALGEGTTFYVSIPVQNEEYEQAKTASKQSDPICSALKRAEIHPVCRSRILLVEDDPTNAFAMAQMLKKRGYEVVVAENGQVALDHLQAERFDVILMDAQMPVMGGVEATKAIREGTAGFDNCSIPIIAMTAYAMVGDRETFLSAGMNDYISKPVEIAQLQILLDRYADNSQ